MLRIALVTHDLSQGGGAATMTAALYQAIKSWGGADARVLSLATSAVDAASVRLTSPRSWSAGSREEERTWRGIVHTHVGAIWPEIEPCRYLCHARTAAHLKDCDVIQFVTGTPAWAHLAVSADRPVSVWAATTVAGDRAARLASARGIRRGLFRAFSRTLQRFERRALTRASLVCGLSRYTVDEFKKITPDKPMEVVPCGVDTALFHPRDHPGGDHPGGSGYMLSVGRFSDPRKNVTLLLGAYAEAIARDANVPELWLVGEPPDQRALDRCRRLGISARVRLLGLKAGEELARLYRNAQFFVMSSDEEGLGIVILEAMASGLPVIATRCGGPQSIIREGIDGLLVSIGDRSAMATAMVDLTRSAELRATLASRGRETAVTSFSTAAFTAGFAARYQRLLRAAA